MNNSYRKDCPYDAQCDTFQCVLDIILSAPYSVAESQHDNINKESGLKIIVIPPISIIIKYVALGAGALETTNGHSPIMINSSARGGEP
jgi:hypothetical protein